MIKTFLISTGVALLVVGLVLFAVDAIAGGNNNSTTNNYFPATTSATTLNTVNEYSIDHCNGVAIAQAGANNSISTSTKSPQLSLGVGECDGELASSLQFGQVINKHLLLNGSWATDEDVNAFGIGATVIFK